MISEKIISSLVLASAVSLSPAVFADTNKDADLSSYSEGDTILVTGTIQTVSEDELTLDYGGKKLEVEFSEWPWADRDMNSFLTAGQKVTVSGNVDKDWLSSNEIEANNIYLEDQYIYYYWIDTSPAYTYRMDQNSNNEEIDDKNRGPVSRLEDGALFSASGEIISIDGREFTLKSGKDTFTVDTMDLNYDPLDDSGLQQLSVGDRVFVTGNIDDEFFSGKELSANAIITLKDASEMSETEEVAKN